MQNEQETVDFELVIRRLLKAYPAFYKPIVKEAEEWIYPEGDFLWTILFGNLADTVKEKVKAEDYDDLDKVFDLMEAFATSGDDILEASALTGFMEALFNNYKDYDTRFLQCYLGARSREFLIGWEKFHGMDSSWLTPHK